MQSIILLGSGQHCTKAPTDYDTSSLGYLLVALALVGVMPAHVILELRLLHDQTILELRQLYGRTDFQPPQTVSQSLPFLAVLLLNISVGCLLLAIDSTVTTLRPHLVARTRAILIGTFGVLATVMGYACPKSVQMVRAHLAVCLVSAMRVLTCWPSSPVAQKIWNRAERLYTMLRGGVQ